MALDSSGQRRPQQSAILEVQRKFMFSLWPESRQSRTATHYQEP